MLSNHPAYYRSPENAERPAKKPDSSLCPAVLSENGYMANEQECRWLQTRAAKQAIVDLHVEGIILDGTAQSSELADNYGVYFPEGAKEDGEFRALLCCAGEFFLKELFASVPFEGIYTT